MDKRKLDEMCKSSGMDAMEALLYASDEIVEESSGRLTSEDLCDLKHIWSAIGKIKTSLAMDEGGNALRRFMN